MTGEQSHVLVVVQNLPVPLDRRVWLECRALKANGYDVSVICPKGPGDPSRQVIEGIHLYKYKPPPAAGGLLGYALEFIYCWLRTAVLSVKVWRRRNFAVMQACNPPDTYWALARLWRSRGVRFVFDQHDLNPELYLSRFGKPTGLSGRVQLAGLKWLERRTYAAAHHVISTNDSYREIALTRGNLPPDDVTVVRSGPDTEQMRPLYPPARKDERRVYQLAYLGIMGPQDNVDLVLDVMHELVVRRGRQDVRAVLMGFGDCLEDLKAEAHERGLAGVVNFTGRVGPDEIAEVLSASDVGLSPDLKTPLNDVSTMNKTMEYMSYALPSVAFDLVETRVSGGDTVLYVPSGDVEGFTDAVERLLDDPDLRGDMAVRARYRVARKLDWRPQSDAYVGVFHRLTGRDDHIVRAHQAVTDRPDPTAYVDLADPDEFRRFVVERSPLSGGA